MDMTMMPTITSLLFYFFAFLTVFSGIMVITARNPVHSVLFLIFAFFNAAGLFVLLGAEYLAMSLIIVYVGAVAVLFLFVVMMLDIDIDAVRQGFVKRLPVGIAVALLFFVQIGALFYASSVHPLTVATSTHSTPDVATVNNTKAIGLVLFTDYVYPFQLAGLILLVGMIGAIVLTHRKREGVRKQVIARQVYRTRDESMAVVSVKSGEGV
jgi:NADH-quinone oxidoreductase subunit J